MLAPTKKHPTDNVVLMVSGPVSHKEEAVTALRALGYTITSENIPWRQAFPEYTDEMLPAACLRGARYKEGITQRELARRTGIPQRHLSEMENGKRPIGKEMARRLAKILNVSYKVLL